MCLDEADVNKVSIKLHKQFGHPAARKLIQLVEQAGNKNKKLHDAIRKVSDNCIVCKKFRRAPARPVVCMPLAKNFNDVMATDLKSWGNEYFLVMIDVATRYCIAVLIGNKRPSTIISGIILHWISLFGAPKSILSDNGGEYNNSDFLEFSENFNINVMTTAAQSPFSNGIVERQNATLGTMVRKIIGDTKCTVEVALAWAVSARNSLANSSGYSPNQLVFGQNPALPNVYCNKLPALSSGAGSEIVRNNLNAMHVARQEFIKYESSEKLQRALSHNVRATEGELIKEGDRVFYKRNQSPEWHGPAIVIGRDGKVFMIRHGGVVVRVHQCRLCSVPGELETSEIPPPSPQKNANSETTEDCCEDDMPLANSKEGPDDPIPESMPLNSDNDSDPSEYESLPSSPIRSEPPTCVRVGQRIRGNLVESGELISGKLLSRAGKVSGKYKNCYNLRSDKDGEVQPIDVEKDLEHLKIIPDDVELLVMYNSAQIQAAKEKEIDNWNSNEVYEEVENVGQKAISVRWVTSEKVKDGETFVKSRLVARGYEENSEDFFKHSPTCSKESVRLTLAIASSNKWCCNSIDVKSAYLQGSPIEREVYLKPPKEFDVGKLWKLHKTVYGLTDAARQWYIRVRSELIKLGAKVSRLDPALFSWEKNGSVQGILCLYVDDILWAGEECFKEGVIDKLCQMFLIGSSSSNDLKYIGLRIQSSNEDGATIDQDDYIKSIRTIDITKERMNNKNSDLSEAERCEFRSLVGQLNWVATQTRPDIAFDVCELSSIQKNATVADLCRLNKVVTFLKNNRLQLHFPRIQCLSECVLEAYADASFANLNGSASQGGFLILLKDGRGNRCPIFWESRRVRRVVKSTLAAETLALVDCAETAIYVKQIICELLNERNLPIICYTDNKSLTDSLASRKSVDDRRLRIDMAELNDMLAQKEIKAIEWISTARQLANPLTKRGASVEQLCAAISRQ